MRNDILKNALSELKSHGIEPIIVHGGKHIKVTWSYQGKNRTLVVPYTPSDYRAIRNNRSALRRILRQDGIAV